MKISESIFVSNKSYDHEESTLPHQLIVAVPETGQT